MAMAPDLTRRALPDDPRPRPWAIYRFGQETLFLPVLEAAKNYANKAYPVGQVVIENIDTAEQWKRRAGKWERTRDSRQTELLPTEPGEAA